MPFHLGPSRQRISSGSIRAVGNEPTALEKAVPIGRLGEPREIAGAVCLFLSEDAAFTTAKVLHVCGGLSVGFAQFRPARGFQRCFINCTFDRGDLAPQDIDQRSKCDRCGCRPRAAGSQTEAGPVMMM